MDLPNPGRTETNVNQGKKQKIPRFVDVRFLEDDDRPERVSAADDQWRGFLAQDVTNRIDAILSEETDRGNVIIVGSVIERLLRHLLDSLKKADPVEHAKRESDAKKQGGGGVEFVINTFFTSGGTSAELNKAFQGLRNLRNFCAHEFLPFDFDNLIDEHKEWLKDFSAAMYWFIQTGNHEFYIRESIRDQFAWDAAFIIGYLNLRSHLVRYQAEQPESSRNGPV